MLSHCLIKSVPPILSFLEFPLLYLIAFLDHLQLATSCEIIDQNLKNAAFG